MYSNWSYLVGLPKAGRRVQCVQSVEKHQPFPYLFFFDYGDFKIFGSSPSTNYCKDRKAEIHPIAGTFKEQVMMKRRSAKNYRR
jgi:anthranilate/para-aminobenzoate synthase component I